MSEKQSSLRTLFQDWKISYRFAFKNVISFILGTLGVLVVTVLLMVVLLVIIVPLFILTIGFEDLVLLFTTLATDFSSISGAAIFGIFALILLPIAAPVLVAVGALFGMGREIVESEGTTAQGVFAWYKSKFLELAGGGIIMFLLAILPVGLLFVFAGPIVFMTPTNATITVFSAGSVIYLTVVMGLLSMVFPAIIDGHSVLDAVRVSLKMSTRYFDRVFSVWISLIGIPTLLVLPLMLTPYFASIGVIAISILGLYGVAVVLFLIFIHFPAAVIVLSRVYMILSGVNGTQHEETQPDIRLVGDV
ncbi:hypothetical protein EU537_05875 [Candidatus Thorarchaeota archaeon]|nr:MAG: hypothetical protein EU537_05875 [Candidatus Thorarchaeota archaeon]